MYLAPTDQFPGQQATEHRSGTMAFRRNAVLVAAASQPASQPVAIYYIIIRYTYMYMHRGGGGWWETVARGVEIVDGEGTRGGDKT